jgi:serine protease Do
MDEDLAKALGMDRPHGALIEEVQPGSPAANAGLKSGDVIVAVDGQNVPHQEDLPRMIAPHKPGTVVHLSVIRDRQTRDVAVTLAPLKEEGQKADQSQPGTDDSASKSSIGISVGDEDGKVVVEHVRGGGPADGKLRPGDVIEEINHQPVTSAGDLSTKIHATPSDKPVLLRVRRGDQSRYVAIDRTAKGG